MAQERGLRYAELLAASINSSPNIKHPVTAAELNPYPAGEHSQRRRQTRGIPLSAGNMHLLKTVFCKRK